MLQIRAKKRLWALALALLILLAALFAKGKMTGKQVDIGEIPPVESAGKIDSFYDESKKTILFVSKHSGKTYYYSTLPVHVKDAKIKVIFNTAPDGTSVSVWDRTSQSFKISSIKDSVWSQDIELVPGEGFVVGISTGQSFAPTLRGKTFSSPVPLKLSTGWNFISFPYLKNKYIYTSGKVLAELQGLGKQCNVIKNGEGSEWYSTLNEYISEKGEKKDFEIKSDGAYFLSCAGISDYEWVPGYSDEKIIPVNEDTLYAPDEEGDSNINPSPDISSGPENPNSGAEEGCSGCISQGECREIGFVRGKEYCSFGGVFAERRKAGEICSGNYECEKGLCNSGKCSGESFWNRLLKLFSLRKN